MAGGVVNTPDHLLVTAMLFLGMFMIVLGLVWFFFLADGRQPRPIVIRRHPSSPVYRVYSEDGKSWVEVD